MYVRQYGGGFASSDKETWAWNARDDSRYSILSFHMPPYSGFTCLFHYLLDTDKTVYSWILLCVWPVEEFYSGLHLCHDGW